MRFSLVRRGVVAALGGAALTAISMTPALTQPASAQGTLRVGMTLADIPVSFGQPDQGFEGFRFMGIMLYDALINWDLAAGDKPSGLVPGLAESWSVSKEDPTKWTFNLRRGVKFHDGSEFNADAVIFNFDKLLDKDSPQFSARQGSLVNFRIPSIKSYRKIDDYTVEFTTHEPDGFVPYQLCYILMASPTQWEKTGKDWNEFAKTPSGTGPWKLAELAPRERAEFVPFKEHWDESRIPKLDKVITVPIPDPNARTAALLSGQVDWIEAPAPDAIPRIESQGFKVVSKVYPHVWSWHLSRVEGSPWNDIRVRKAANLAIDREGNQGAARRLRHPGLRPCHAGRSLVRLADVRDQVRSRGGEGPAEGGWLRPRQPRQGQGADLRQRLGPDAAPADERIHAAEPQGRRHRRRVRGDGVERVDRPLAGRRQVAPGGRRACHQRQLYHPGSVQLVHPLPA